MKLQLSVMGSYYLVPNRGLKHVENNQLKCNIFVGSYLPDYQLYRKVCFHISYKKRYLKADTVGDLSPFLLTCILCL
jgi:hypothetical protein